MKQSNRVLIDLFKMQLVLIAFVALITHHHTLALDRQGESFDSSSNQALLAADGARKEADDNMVAPQEPLLSSDISLAIEKYMNSMKSKASKENSLLNDERDGPVPRNESALEKRKVIRSRYRLRAHRDSAPVGQQQTANTMSISNYSQPFDQQAQPEVSAAPATTYGIQNHYQTLARALVQPTVSMAVPDQPVSSYNYAPSPVQHRVATASPMGGEASASLYSASSVDPAHARAQDNEALVEAYSHPVLPSHSQQMHVAAASRMYPSAISGSARFSPPSLSMAASSGAPGDPAYYGAPSMVAFGDHYGSATSISQPSSASAERDHYEGQRNYSENQPEFAGSHLSSWDYLDSPLLGRSRWSWPWTDVSSFGSYGLDKASPMNTAATFKKHHHHHYYPKHKDHHHHHDEHELMSKWEHGITIGEIVCVAVAVVLGIIILGSPFFLLFLMLFNGGNLFGTTQMGLLAPAAVQAATSPAGRRRRRRSVGSSDEQGDTGSAKKIKTSDLVRAGEYLFEKLSPYMDGEKLMRSFERLMDVKDDIEVIIAKIGQQDKAAHREHSAARSGKQHDEMRRRKRK